MARTKFCPACGSCAVATERRVCRCQQCGHEGRPGTFTADAYQSPLANWGSDAYGPRGTDPIHFERGRDDN